MNAPKLAAMLTMFAILIACSQSASNKPNTAENTNKPTAAAQPARTTEPVNEVASGKELYATNCQICHQETGKGGKVTVKGKQLDPADLTSDHMKKHDDAKIFKHISDGVPDEGMPAFKDKLSIDQINEVVKYIRTLQGA